MEEKEFAKLQEGDRESVEKLFASTWKDIYRFIYYKVQNREEAEDITQETYVRALDHIRRSDKKIEKHVDFLKTVSLNILRDRWRKRSRRGTMVGIESIDPTETAVEDSSDIVSQRELIRNALDRLSEEQRKVIELRIIKGYSTAETAKIMNKKEGTIRVLQYRGLKALAELLKNSV
ncbi:MAG: RNA polymerase sigma factor [Clostridiales bacterium]|nr:RNA polymerase sigma factor [Clostridiales bacterium]